MKHFGINSARRKTSGRSRFARSLFSAHRSPCFFYSFLFSSSLSSFQSRLLSPRAFLAFFFFLLSRRHLPTSGNLQGTNIWEMQFEHLSATKERQTMLEKTRGINTPPTWCWTNMSHCLQFTDGPATASGAHRCGNSRTNLIAPMVPFFFSGLFLGLFARRVCPTVVWQIRSFRDVSFKNDGMAALRTAEVVL